MTMITAPEGVEINLRIYIHSAEKGIDAHIDLSGMKSLAPFEGSMDPAAMMKNLMPTLASDWRLMSNAEIIEYKEAHAADADDEEEDFE